MLTAFAGLAVLTLLAVGLVQLARSSPGAPKAVGTDRPQMQARLANSPAPLAALHAQANQLLAGDAHVLHARLASAARVPGGDQQVGLDV